MRALTRVLVVEDEALIGIDLGDMLASIGARDVTLCANCDEAERAIFTEDFALAVLDVELGGESCERLVPCSNIEKSRSSLQRALCGNPFPPPCKTAPM